jgi:hypothetical protein
LSVKTIKHNVEQDEGKGRESLSEAGGNNERRQQDEPKLLTMAKMLKDNESILKKTKLVEGSKNNQKTDNNRKNNLTMSLYNIFFCYFLYIAPAIK